MQYLIKIIEIAEKMYASVCFVACTGDSLTPTLTTQCIVLSFAPTRHRIVHLLLETDKECVHGMARSTWKKKRARSITDDFHEKLYDADGERIFTQEEALRRRKVLRIREEKRRVRKPTATKTTGFR